MYTKNGKKETLKSTATCHNRLRKKGKAEPTKSSSQRLRTDE